MGRYESMVSDLKALSQGTSPDPVVTLPMAEDEWNTRPDTVSYGIVQKEFEADALRGDDVKTDTAFGGSVDLFSLQRNGAGWVPLITGTLTKWCGGCWSLNSHTYERETGLFHWEWEFEVED